MANKRLGSFRQDTGGSPLGSFRQDAGPAVGRFPLASFCRPGVRAIPGGFVLPECRPAAGFVLPIHRAIPGGFVLPECRPAIGFVPPRRRTVPVGFVPPRRRSIPVGFVPPKQQQVRWVRFGQNSSRFVGFVSPKQQQVRWVRFAKALVTPIGFVLPKCQAIPVGRRFRAANCRVKCHFAHGSRFSRASARSAGTRSAHRLRARKHGHVAHCTIFKDAPFIQNPVILSSVLYCMKPASRAAQSAQPIAYARAAHRARDWTKFNLEHALASSGGARQHLSGSRPGTGMTSRKITTNSVTCCAHRKAWARERRCRRRRGSVH